MIKVVLINRDKFIPSAQYLSTFADRRVKHIQSICIKKSLLASRGHLTLAPRANFLIFMETVGTYI